jgi:hypothetical protein
LEPAHLIELHKLNYFISISFLVTLANTAFYESVLFESEAVSNVRMSFNDYLYLIESLKSVFPIFLGIE